MSDERQKALESRCQELTDLLRGRFVVSEANKEIVTALVRLAETITYGESRTPKRSHHHGEDDPTGLPPPAPQTREQVLASLTAEQRKALGY